MFQHGRNCMRGFEQNFVPGGRRRGSLAIATTSAAAAIVLCAGLASAPAAAKDIKICLIAGKTGALEAYAKQTENGFMMGLEYLTQGSNTVGDNKLLIIVKDDQLKPDRGKTLLEECYGDDGAALAVGTTGSPVALAMLPVAEEHKKVLIVEPAVADSITGDKWNRYIFRTGRSSYQDALAGAAAFPKTGEVAVGMLGLDTAFGHDGGADIKEARHELHRLDIGHCTQHGTPEAFSRGQGLVAPRMGLECFGDSQLQ